MGPRSSKIQADTVTEDSITDSSFSIINLQTNSATSGALLVIFVLGLSIAKFLVWRKLRKAELKAGQRMKEMGSSAPEL